MAVKTLAQISSAHTFALVTLATVFMLIKRNAMVSDLSPSMGLERPKKRHLKQWHVPQRFMRFRGALTPSLMFGSFNA